MRIREHDGSKGHAVSEVSETNGINMGIESNKFGHPRATGSEKVPLRSATSAVGRGNIATLSFEKAYATGKDSSLRASFVKALESVELEDSEINFT